MVENETINAILLQASLTFLLLGALFALLLGVVFLLSPQWVKRLSQHTDRWISLRKSTKPLEMPRPVEHSIYRYHRPFGLIVLISAAYTLFRFAFTYDHTTLLLALTQRFGHPVIVEWFLEAFLWFILPATLLMVFVGAAIALKPSWLKGAEQWGNRWISTRKGMLPLEKQYLQADNWAFAHPRLFGAILVISSLYILSMLLISL